MFYISHFSCLICSASYMFYILYIPCLKRFKLFFRCLDSLDFNSCFGLKSCLELTIIIKVKREDIRKSAIYIIRAANPIFFSSDQTHNLTYSLMRFSLNLLTNYRVGKTLTCTCTLPANTFIFVFAFWSLIPFLTFYSWPTTLTWPLTWPVISDWRPLTCNLWPNLLHLIHSQWPITSDFTSDLPSNLTLT